MLIQWKSNKKGVLIIETLVVIGIIGIVMTALLGVVNFSLGISALIKETTQANLIVQKTVEELRNFRDGTTWDSDGLGTVTTETPYHFQKSADSLPKWQLIQGEEVIDIFTRKTVFDDVQRDAGDNIVESGGVNDPNTKKSTSTVSWVHRGEEKNIEIVTYFTNWR